MTWTGGELPDPPFVEGLGADGVTSSGVGDGLGVTKTQE